MGISDFRREVQRWLNAVLFSARQDAESDSASRRPIDAIQGVPLMVESWMLSKRRSQRQGRDHERSGRPSIFSSKHR